ncbi:MAG: hypothetical protein H0T88_06160 [Lysobacter sp.]|nr:hypothetical protein [Lysobacter sp.]
MQQRPPAVDALEALIGGTAKTASERRPAPKLQQQLEQLSRLPKTQQRRVSQLIDTVSQQQRA